MIQHRARKHLGQNFLQDQSVIQNILHVFGPKEKDKVIEIGPGLGALTHPLMNQLGHLTVIEIDRDLQRYWQTQYPHQMDVLCADALTVDFSALGSDLRVIGNLPYNISTPLLFHLLTYCACIQDMHFMLQKEVVDRLCAQPNTKNYGRLSIMVQYHCDVECLFLVAPEAFHPKPKVNSAVVRLTPHTTPCYPMVDKEALKSLVASAFSMRRKTLANNLKNIISVEELRQLDIDPTQRPEQIPIEAYVRIVQSITK